MRRLAPFLCLMTMPFYLAFTVATPDFSGIWIRDADKSDEMATIVNGKVTPVSVDLIIKHAGNNLQVESRWDYQAPTTMNYIIDGNKNSCSDQRGNAVAYRSSWDQDKLIINEVVNAKTPFGHAEIKTRSEWSLSDRGNTLTITAVTDSSSRKQVYHR